MAEVFSQWTDQQLKDYLNENGAPSYQYATRQQLIDLCLTVGADVEARVVRQTSVAVAPPATHLAFNHVPVPIPPAGGPKKKAFVCGINYFGTRSQLEGCINDAR